MEKKKRKYKIVADHSQNSISMPACGIFPRSQRIVEYRNKRNKLESQKTGSDFVVELARLGGQ